MWTEASMSVSSDLMVRQQAHKAVDRNSGMKLGTVFFRTLGSTAEAVHVKARQRHGDRCD